MRLTALTLADEAFETLDDETAAALLAYRYRQLSDAGFSPVAALMLAARTERSLDSLIRAFNNTVGAAA